MSAGPQDCGRTFLYTCWFCGCHHFLSVNPLNIYRQSVKTWYLITQMKYFFFWHQGTEINLAFYMIGKSGFLSRCVVILAGAEHWRYRFSRALNNDIHCVLYSICWMRQHWTVGLAGVNTGYCGKAMNMLAVTKWQPVVITLYPVKAESLSSPSDLTMHHVSVIVWPS